VIRRRLSAVASAISLLLCLATLGFWPTDRQTTILMVPLPTGLSVGIDAGPDSTLWVRDQFATRQELDVVIGDTPPWLDPRVALWDQARAPHEGHLLIWRWGSDHLLGGGVGEMGHFYERDDGIVRWFAMPPWLAAAILAAPPAIWVRTWFRQSKRRRRGAAGLCVSCGYSLAGNTSGVCPECGTKLKSPPFLFHGPGMDVSEGVIEVGVDERYSLTISTSITASNPIEVQIKRVNEAMRRWLRARVDGCGRLVISIAADPTEAQHILSWAIRLVDQNIPEASSLRKLQIELLLCDGSGKEFDRMILGEPA
jgi:hypothetical protein